MKPATWLRLAKESFNTWLEAKSPTMGAALAYYTAFSIAPLLVIALALASLWFGPEAASGQLAEEMRTTFGEPVSNALQGMIKYAHQNGSGVLQTIVGLAVLLFGASGVFAELQSSLNTIWGVEAKPGSGIVGIIRDRFLSFTMVLGTCFLLLTSLVVTALLEGLAKFWTPASLPGTTYFWQALNLTVSFAVVCFLFAMCYKVLPDARIAWRDVWVGAAVNTLLFTLGKYLLTVYLVYTGTTSAYGAAGSLVLILMWFYYSAQIFLFGAAFTRAYAEHHGRSVQPTKNALLVTKQTIDPDATEARKEQLSGRPYVTHAHAR